jgi:hypothetical protein
VQPKKAAQVGQAEQAGSPHRMPQWQRQQQQRRQGQQQQQQGRHGQQQQQQRRRQARGFKAIRKLRSHPLPYMPMARSTTAMLPGWPCRGDEKHGSVNGEKRRSKPGCQAEPTLEMHPCSPCRSAAVASGGSAQCKSGIQSNGGPQ